MPGLTARPGGPGGGAVKTVVIDGYRIVLDTDGGPVTIEGSRAEANFIDGDADIRADATIASALGRIAGRLEATLFGGGEILGRFFVDEGNISAAQGGARALRGVVQLIVGAQGPELDARLDIEGLEPGGRKIPTARIAIAATGGLDAIAIDGPAASGKGTLARRLAVHLGLRYLDTGSLYRAIGLTVLKAGQDPTNEAQALAAAKILNLGHWISLVFGTQILRIPMLSRDCADNCAARVSV